MGLAEVINLYETNADNVPDMLRALATAIDEGEYGDIGAMRAVCVLDSEDVITTFGWGRGVGMEGVAYFMLGKAMRAMDE